jgi:hypothetical protein
MKNVKLCRLIKNVLKKNKIFVYCIYIMTKGQKETLKFTFQRPVSSRGSRMNRKEREEARRQQLQIHPYYRRRLLAQSAAALPLLGHSRRHGFDTDPTPSLTRAKKKMEANIKKHSSSFNLAKKKMEAIIKKHSSSFHLVKKFLYWGLVLAAAAAPAGISAILAAETANDVLRECGLFEFRSTARARGREPWLSPSVRVNMQLAMDYIRRAPSDLPLRSRKMIVDVWAGLNGAVKQMSWTALLYHVFINRKDIWIAVKWMNKLALRAVEKTRGAAAAKDLKRVAEEKNAGEGAVADARRAEAAAVAEEEAEEMEEDEDKLHEAQWFAEEQLRRKQAALREQALRKQAAPPDAHPPRFSHPGRTRVGAAAGAEPYMTYRVVEGVRARAADEANFYHNVIAPRFDDSNPYGGGGKKTKHKRKKRNRCASKKYKKSSKRKSHCCASKKHRRSSKSKRSPTRRSRM